MRFHDVMQITKDDVMQCTGEYILHQFFAGVDLGYVPIAAIILTESGDVELRGTLPEGSAVARLAERLREWYARMAAGEAKLVGTQLEKLAVLRDELDTLKKREIELEDMIQDVKEGKL